MFTFLKYHKSPFLIKLRLTVLNSIKKLFPNNYFFIIFKLRSFFQSLVLFIYYFYPKKKLSKTFYYVGSDKYYNYKELYEILQYLLPKTKVKKILEIGVGGHNIPFGGGQSLRALQFFYSNANILGLDIIDKSFLDSGRIKTIAGDQSDEIFLNKLGNEYGPFDLIIDDGSHFVSHQKKTFKNLFNYLNSEGVYICEDCSTSYLVSGEGDPYLSEEKNMFTYFSKLTHAANVEFLIKEKFDLLNNFKTISKVLFFKGAVLIHKNLKKDLVAFDDRIARESLEDFNKKREFSAHKDKSGFIKIVN
jgi:demethylmacrocin O-methyltransferase